MKKFCRKTHSLVGKLEDKASKDDSTVLLGSVLIVYECVDMKDNVLVIHKFSCDSMNNFTEIKHCNQVSGIDLCTIESKAAILVFKSSIRGGDKVKSLATSQTEHHSVKKIGDFFFKSVFLRENL